MASEGSFGEDPDFAVYLDSPAPMQASLTTGVAAVGDGTDSLVEIEGLTSAPRSATRSRVTRASTSSSAVHGTIGSTGLGGFDFLQRRRRDDAFDGGPGEDLAYYDLRRRQSPSTLPWDCLAVAAPTRITASRTSSALAFDDRSPATPGRNALFSGSTAPMSSPAAGGADLLRGDAAGDVLNGGAGPDRLTAAPDGIA